MAPRSEVTTRDQRPPRVTRDAPGCVMFLVDQSGSMKQQFIGTQYTKADAVALAINETLYHLLANCAPEGDVWDYFHIGAIGYGGKGVRCAFGGALEGLPLAKASVVEAARRIRTVQVEQDGELRSIKQPEWLSPVASGTTPMVAAVTEATRILDEWCHDFPDSAPPVVLNVSDGNAKDGDPREAAEGLRFTGTSHGQTLLFNLQLTAEEVEPIKFPVDDSAVADPFARVLFEMSSVIPPYVLAIARKRVSSALRDGARGFCCNADMSTVADFFLVGTPTA